MKCVIKIGKTMDAGSPKLAKKVQEAYRLDTKMREYKAQLEETNAEIIAEIMPGIESQEMKTGHITTGTVGCKIQKRISLKIADYDGLKSVLKGRINDLVRTKTVHEPEKKLREIAENPHDPLYLDVIDALEIKEGKPAVTFELLQA